MKQYTSKFLKSVAAILIAFPIVYIVFAAMIFDIPLSACGSVLLSPFYYVVSFAVLMSGVGLWEMRRWSWHLILISQALVIYENAYMVVTYSETHHKALAFLFTLIFQAGLLYRVAREVRVPYFFPKIRWWESNPRYRFSASVKMRLVSSSEHSEDGEILDLSVAGCFVKYRPDLQEGEKVFLNFRVFGYQFALEGTVVWCAQSAVTHPKGIGIKFGVMTRTQKRELRSVGRRLRKIAALYRTSRYLMSPEEFLGKLQELESANGQI